MNRMFVVRGFLAVAVFPAVALVAVACHRKSAPSEPPVPVGKPEERTAPAPEAEPSRSAPAAAEQKESLKKKDAESEAFGSGPSGLGVSPRDEARRDEGKGAPSAPAAKAPRRAKQEAASADALGRSGGANAFDTLFFQLDAEHAALLEALAPSALSCSGAEVHRKAVCDIAEQLCDVAQQSPEVSSMQSRCEQGRQRCADANSRYRGRCTP